MIQVQALCFSHPGGIAALREVDLRIQPGARVAIVGANGSGKTTLARCLNGLHRPEAGEVLVDGLSTSEAQALFAIRQLVGMVFQNPDDQLVSTQVETEIAFGLENIGLDPRLMRERVDEALRQFHLEPYRRHPPHHLSGGEKQRVAIAAAVALRPRYLVLDEPTALLDPRSQHEVSGLLASLRDQFGIATIHITQLPGEAAQTERVLVMHQGRLLADGPPGRIFGDAQLLREAGLEAPFASALGLAVARRTGTALPAALHLEELADALAALPLRPTSPPADEPATSAPAHAKLAIRHLSHGYDAGLPTYHGVLDAVDLEVPPGSLLALLGPSGSGKTTLAQHFNGLIKPQSGQVLLDDQDIWLAPDQIAGVRRRVGLVFQFPELQLFEETLEQDVAFGPRNLGVGPPQLQAQVDRALELVDLPRAQFGKRPPLSLSGGEKRRAALAGVLAMDPEVLVLDEPTAGLDPRSTQHLTELFRQFRAEGKTLVLIAHDMDLVAELATHVAVLGQGRLQLCGPARQILTHPDFSRHSGLEAPAAVRLMQALSARGVAVPGGVLRFSEAVDFLAAALSPEG
ncbi:MAG: ATP-binding cassette domain-containing protein [Candidatus Latescibacteria bacterium]|nr:ATP-binding cassette domain-containing protein [Candidatus Latescibacterota bacterium]